MQTNVLLLQLDGKLPSISLMRLAHHYQSQGASVQLRRIGNAQSLAPEFDDPAWAHVYGSLIFERTRPLAQYAQQVYPGIVLGGTGWDESTTLEGIGITTLTQDYSNYPRYRQSLGFTQRGCRLRCSFCKVPVSEGAIREEQTVADIWRGDPWPRELLLLDNDF